MTVKNITTNRIINVAGRLLDPQQKISMTIEYYAEHRGFVDQYVTDGYAEVEGIEEYERFTSAVLKEARAQGYYK